MKATRTAIRGCRDVARGVTRVADVLPPSLAASVIAVFGIDELLPVPAKPTAGAGGQFPGEDIYPKVIKAQYQLRAVGGKSKMTQGVAA